MPRLLNISLILCLLASVPADALSVIMYHRFGEGEYPSTNTTLEQLSAHIELLKQKPVLPLAEAIARLQNGENLDDAVAITVDDAFTSFYENGLPEFLAAELPLTLFVATDLVGGGGYMDERMLRETELSGLVTIGNHGTDHRSFAELGEAEIKAVLEKSQAAFAELGLATPTLFSYPYGEAGEREIRLLQQSGFAAAFGQHSGGIAGTIGAAIGTGIGTADGDPDWEWFYLPRFPLNERYGGEKRVATALDAKPLPLRLHSPRQPSAPFDKITLEALDGGGGGLNCFTGNGEPIALSKTDDLIELSLPEPFGIGRNRINCTEKKNGGWGWFGWQFFLKGDESEG